MRLIYADAYAEYINKVLKQIEEDTSPINPDGFIIATSIVKGIEEDMKDETITPTIDAIPVIRCKDCEFFSDPGTFTGRCDLRGDYIFTNDFCSYAVWRNDNKLEVKA